MQKSALAISSLVFSLVTIGHIMRYLLGWDMIIGEFEVSLSASLFAGIATAVLATWTFLASRKS